MRKVKGRKKMENKRAMIERLKTSVVFEKGGQGKRRKKNGKWRDWVGEENRFRWNEDAEKLLGKRGEGRMKSGKKEGQGSLEAGQKGFGKGGGLRVRRMGNMHGPVLEKRKNGREQRPFGKKWAKKWGCLYADFSGTNGRKKKKRVADFFLIRKRQI